MSHDPNLHLICRSFARLKEEQFDDWGIPKLESQRLKEASGKGKSRDEYVLNHLRAVLIFSSAWEEELKDREKVVEDKKARLKKKQEGQEAAERLNKQAQESKPPKKSEDEAQKLFQNFQEKLLKARTTDAKTSWKDKTQCPRCRSYWNAWQLAGLKDTNTQLTTQEQKDPNFTFYKWKACNFCNQWWCPECRSETWINKEHLLTCTDIPSSSNKAKVKQANVDTDSARTMQMEINENALEFLKVPALKQQLALRLYPTHGNQPYLLLRLKSAIEREKDQAKENLVVNSE